MCEESNENKFVQLFLQRCPRIFHAVVGTAVGAGGNPDLHAGVSRARRPGERCGLGTTVQGAAFAAAREQRTSFAVAGWRKQVL